MHEADLRQVLAEQFTNRRVPAAVHLPAYAAGSFTQRWTACQAESVPAFVVDAVTDNHLDEIACVLRTSHIPRTHPSVVAGSGEMAPTRAGDQRVGIEHDRCPDRRRPDARLGRDVGTAILLIHPERYCALAGYPVWVAGTVRWGREPSAMTSTSDDSTFAEIVGTEVDTSDRLAAIDHQIATLNARVKATSPRFAALVPRYRADIDALLDLRLWLTDATV